MISLLIFSIPPLGDIIDLLFILFVLLGFPICIGYLLWIVLWDSSAIFRGVVKFIWYILLFPVSLPISYLQKIYRKKVFKRKASKQIPKTREALERLKEFFLPIKRIEQNHINKFLSEYWYTIHAVDKLYQDKNRDDSILTYLGIGEFHE